ncbi:sigma-70 family RNA polymerase sigma factor [Sphingobacterium humi]|uniref:Sigma-70 family RNA polymerase sigma factor n=1 Tax=Sphingobacterium humi TaxID=1796905 RepID=A0A6N8L3E7_9SPHI|nr:sigma-70 family RNA polymerase sigma factor [Sphingobacterium humi]
MHSDQKHIRSLLKNDTLGIKLIYSQYAKSVIRMIESNNGSEDDGFDILQESLIDIYNIALHKDFQLTTSFQSFLLLVAKRKWLNQLKKNKLLEVTKLTDQLLNDEDHSESQYNEHLLQNDKENTLMELLATLGESCKDIITRCMKEKRQEKIAESLGISYAYLRKKKSQCMSKLAQKCKNHPVFKRYQS